MLPKAAGNFEVEQRPESALLALRSLSQSTRHAPTEPFRDPTFSELHVTLALRPSSFPSPPFAPSCPPATSFKMGDEVKIDKDIFQSRLGRLVASWKADKLKGEGSFNGANSIIILLGKSEDSSYQKSNTMHVRRDSQCRMRQARC